MGKTVTYRTGQKLAKVYKAPSRYQRWMLYALNMRLRNIYAGTVPEAEVRRRRAANKVARRQRRVNRGG